MASTKRRKPDTVRRQSAQEQDREHARKALNRAVKRERDIQRLAKQLDREMQKSNDRIQSLAVVLQSRARAIEAEREATEALH